MLSAFILTLVSLVTAYGSAAADPGTASRFLMNEPVSLLDYGLDYLDKEALDQFRDIGIAGAAYDWNKDEIQVHLINTGTFANKKEAEAFCHSAIARIKKWLLPLGVAPKVGDPLPIGPLAWFEHHDYTNTRKPTSLARDVVGIIQVMADATFREDQRKRVYMACKSALNAPEVYCAETPRPDPSPGH